MPPTTAPPLRPTCALALLLAVVAAPAADGAERQAAPPVPLGALAVAAADLDGDGSIDEGELGQDLIEAFLDLDRDEDGALDPEEVAGGTPEQFAAVAGDDGRLDFVEAAAAKRARFRAADADGDGRLSRGEIAAVDGG